MSSPFPSPPPPQRASIGARCFLSVIGLILAGAGGFFTYQMWQSYKRAAETYAWQEVPCLISYSKVEEERLTLNSPVSYIPVIKYSFIQEDMSVISEKIKRVAGLKFKDKADAEALVAKYPAGQGAQCFVNPNDPKDVILVRDNKGALYSIWFPLLFVIGGLGMVINIWWPEPPEETKTPATPAPTDTAEPS
jgi:Protein of unknown function (DUF3592)